MQKNKLVFSGQKPGDSSFCKKCLDLVIDHWGSWHFPVYKYHGCFDFCSNSGYFINSHREEVVLFISLDVYSASNTTGQGK